MKKTKFIYGSLSVILTIAVGILILAIAGIVHPKVVVEAADTYTLTVEKTSTVSVYVTGSGVEKTSSTSNYDYYTVETGTRITLRAVSESKIFTNWLINSNSVTTNPYTFTPSADTTIKVQRTDPTTSDKGKYMNNRFLISTYYDLYSLQYLFEVGDNATNALLTATLFTKDGVDHSLETFYNTLFAEDATWASYTTVNQKVAAINSTYFARCQIGYYLVPQSFAYFDATGSLIFTGIGTSDHPFNGVFDGLNATDTASLFIVTSLSQTDAGYVGLFGYLGSAAVVRNLHLDMSISIEGSTETNKYYYIGGVAGYNSGAFIYNVDCYTRHTIAINGGTTANYAFIGGLFGYMNNAGLEQYGAVVLNETGYSWSISKSSAYDIVSVGLVAGGALNSYVNNAELKVGSFNLTGTSLSTNSSTGYIALGNLFGYYSAQDANSLDKLYLRNINITGSDPEQLTSTVHYGDSYVGGLAGYVNARSNVYVGKVNFDITSSSPSTYEAKSYNASSNARLFAGGLFGRVYGAYLSATDEFKYRITEKTVEDKTYKVYDYLFDINLNVYATNYGQSARSTTSDDYDAHNLAVGATYAGGLVGRGRFDLSGTAEKHSSILLTSSSYTLNVVSTQKSTTTKNETQQNNYLCSSGLLYGLIYANSISYNYIDLYAEKFLANVVRELESTTIGNLNVGAFAGYAADSTFSHINLYLNDGQIRCDGLSYATYYGGVGNNTMCGGFLGGAHNTSLQYIKLCGYDFENDTEVGTTSQIMSIQNTQPGGGDIRADNYCAGIIGLATACSTIDNCTYVGSKTSKDYIQMQGHQSPDSAFCGGIVGLVNQLALGNGYNNGRSTSVTNCLVTDADIYGGATTTTNINNPDIYVGGILGACYRDGGSASLTVDNCRVYRSSIKAIANNLIQAFAGGIAGGVTWNGTRNITNCYITSCTVEAIAKGSTSYQNFAQAGGIVGYAQNGTTNIRYCVVSESVINAEGDATAANGSKGTSRASGIVCQYGGSSTTTNCYSNSTVTATAPLTVVRAISNSTISNGSGTSSYYVEQNMDDSYTAATNENGLDFSKKEITSTATNIFTALSDRNLAYKNKYYIIIPNNDNFTVNIPNNTSTVVSINQNGYTDCSNLAYVFINAKSGGDTSVTEETFSWDTDVMNDAGWFLLGYVIVYNGNPSTVTGTATDPLITYVSSGQEYRLDQATGNFINQLYPYDTYVQSDFDNIGYVEEDGVGTIPNHSTIDVVKDIDIYLRANLLSFRLKFSVPATSASLYVTFMDEEGNEITLPAAYGSHSFNSETITIDEVDYKEYTFEFIPNEDLEEDAVFYLTYKIESSNDYVTYGDKFTLHHNARVLESVEYASYTPPLNYYDSENLGEVSNPYILKASSTTKLIPIFTKVNDLPESAEAYTFDSAVTITDGMVDDVKYYELVDGIYQLTEDTTADTTKTYYTFVYPQYDSETNVDYVTYTINNTNTGTMKSNGEFVARSDISGYTDNYYVTVTLNEDTTQSIRVYYNFQSSYTVSYSATGADLDGLLFVSYSHNYYFTLLMQNGYSGVPTTFTVKIGNTTYDLVDNLASYPWLKDQTGNTVTDYSVSNLKYVLTIPTSYINGNIAINATFAQKYTVTFNLQCSDFAPNYNGSQTLVYEVLKDTKFSDYFDSTKLSEIDAFTNAALNTLTGYLFTGYYLITNANNKVSYTSSFEDIVASDIKIDSSFIFYARWSFLIEIVEAPGTHVTTAFTDDFMVDYSEYTVVQNTISIPLNNNNGYIFSVTTDDDFTGDVSVKAYCICQDTNGNNQLVELELSYYNNDSSIYYIKKNQINGYVLIVTSVSNSHIIVGKNTAQISDEILPHDGIFTFKYVVNHYNVDSDTKSYIFSNNNLSKTKDLMISIFKQVYDSENNKIVLENYNLPQGTIVEIYYSSYIDESTIPDKAYIGTYQVTDDTTSVIHLKDFYKLNYNEKVYTEETFQQLIGSHTSLSEVYYITVTPPNGYDISDSLEFRDIENHVIQVGYVELVNGSYEYITGERTGNSYNIINLNDDEDLSQLLEATVSDETSLQEAVYAITPSRKTTLTKDGNTYTFSDLMDYSLSSLTYTNCDLTIGNEYVKLFDDEANGKSTIVSSRFSQGFLSLNLNLGYNTGIITVYGSNDGTNWTKVSDIDVVDVEYNDYTVYFDDVYQYIKIENNSLNTIYLKSITYSSYLTGLEYNINISEYNESELVSSDPTNNIYTYKLVKTIVGDLRHNGKIFTLAIQLDDSGIVSDITPSVQSLSITYIDGNSASQTVTLEPELSDLKGKNTLFFNLTSILNTYDIESFTFTINTDQDVNSVVLYEGISTYKPSISEVRYIVYQK